MRFSPADDRSKSTGLASRALEYRLDGMDRSTLCYSHHRLGQPSGGAASTGFGGRVMVWLVGAAFIVFMIGLGIVVYDVCTLD
jgi:hypothetical protein